MAYTIEQIKEIMSQAQDDSIYISAEIVRNLASQLLEEIEGRKIMIDILSSYESALASTLDIMPSSIEGVPMWNSSREKLVEAVLFAIASNDK